MKAVTPCPRPVYNAIKALIDALNKTYGGDYAFIISGRGHTLAASTMILGVLPPKVGEPK